MAKSLALSQMLAGKVSHSAGVSDLESPTRSPFQAPEAAKPATPVRQGDRVEISSEARELAAAEAGPRVGNAEEAGGDNPLRVSSEEQAVLRELQTRDAEVRAHENAHAGAGGAAAGTPSFTFQKGPDGRQYAVGGEVPISIQSGSTPQETLRNAAQVRAAALAPAQPSSADRSVAAAATSMEMQARQEIAQERTEAERGEAAEEADATSSFVEPPPVDPAAIDPRARAYDAAPSAAVEPILVDLFG